MRRELLLLAHAVAAIAIAPHYPLVGHPPLAGPRVRTKARERFTEFVAQRSGLLLIDVENVRGKTGFVLGHEELLRRVGGWAMRCGLHGRVALVVDHGSVAEAFLLKESGLSVAFAGPAQTADDVLVRTVPARGALVVTADGQLGRRCRRRASDGGGSVSLAPPSLLLDALGVDASAAGLAQAAAEAAAAEAAAAEAAAAEAAAAAEGVAAHHEANCDAVGSTEAAAAAAAAAAVPWMQAIEHEMRLRAAVVRCERHGAKVLGARKGKARVARRAHGSRIAELRRQLLDALAASADAGAPSVESVVSVGPGLGAEATAEQDALIDALLARRGPPREEHTYTRVLLAERLRRRLARGVFGECEATSPADESPLGAPAASFTRQVNARLQRTRGAGAS